MANKYIENNRAPDVESARLAHVQPNQSIHQTTHQSNLVFLTPGEQRLQCLIDRLLLVELIDGRFYLGYLHVIDQSTIILDNANYVNESPLSSSNEQSTNQSTNQSNNRPIRDVSRVGQVLIKLEHVKKCSIWTSQETIDQSFNHLAKLGKPIVNQTDNVILQATNVQYRNPPIYLDNE